ncbi:MAG: hypothetical protein HY855_22665 [Burkholderiales bacterium]|nr:hypothetical protein [Burkholderiales bacterium]
MKANANASVSQRAMAGFDHFVAQAAKSSLCLPGTECSVLPAADEAPREREVVMLTVSSYVFRALLFVHFERDAVTRAHFAALAQTPVESMSDERYIDAVMECGNLCCGALNRDLAAFYPHIGMSTPCILDRNCLAHVDGMHPAFHRRYRAELGSGVALHLTLAVCAFADIDFPFEPRAVEEESAGELEMF